MTKRIKKILKLVAVVAVAGIVVFAGVMVNEIFGNPVSKHLAAENSVAFVEENYPDLEFEAGETGYDFKGMRYFTEFTVKGDEDISFTVSCDRKGDYYYDDYDWIALLRFENAATKEISPALIKEFGEESKPEITIENFHELEEKKLVTINQAVDFDNFPFELNVDINVYTDEAEHSEIIADAIRRIDSAVDDRFTIANYTIDIYNADGTELTDYVMLPAEGSKFAY